MIKNVNKKRYPVNIIYGIKMAILAAFFLLYPDGLSTSKISIDIIIIVFGYKLFEHLYKGPGFNPKTNFADDCTLDQLEANGYLNAEQLKSMHKRMS